MDEDARSGQDGTGGGGGGGNQPAPPKKGGSGVVIVRYLAPTGDGDGGGLLDAFVGNEKPVAAYALRRLFHSYSGPQVRVKRSGGGSATADVYYNKYGAVTALQETGGNTHVSLEEWLGGADSGDEALVEIWYDQSPSGNDAIQRDGAPAISRNGLKFNGREAFEMKPNDTNTLRSDEITGFAVIDHGKNEGGTNGIFGGGSRLHFELRGGSTWRIRLQDAFRQGLPHLEVPYSITFRKDRRAGVQELLQNSNVFGRRTGYTSGWNAWGRLHSSGRGPPGIGKSLDGHRSSRFWVGHISCYLMFDKYLDDGKIRDLDRALRVQAF